MNLAACKLSAFLKRERMAQSLFAERIGVRDSTVSRLIKGERTPSLNLAKRISDETRGDVTTDEWLCPVPDNCEAAA